MARQISESLACMTGAEAVIFSGGAQGASGGQGRFCGVWLLIVGVNVVRQLCSCACFCCILGQKLLRVVAIIGQKNALEATECWAYSEIQRIADFQCFTSFQIINNKGDVVLGIPSSCLMRFRSAPSQRPQAFFPAIYCSRKLIGLLARMLLGNGFFVWDPGVIKFRWFRIFLSMGK